MTQKLTTLSRKASTPSNWPSLADLANSAKAWPYQEARRIMSAFKTMDPVVFQTGYGPSGLPHLGTFSEVMRTHWIRQAFTDLTDRPSKLIAFSDDMDGLRKVPTNIPHAHRLEEFLDQPLTSVPDPFETHDSFAAHNNAKLIQFLDSSGLDYTFYSATECYRSGIFDSSLLKALEHYQEIMDVMLPTLGPERRKTYSPFMPICRDTNRVLQVPTLECNPSQGTIVYQSPDTGKKVETSITSGACKLQWKADWALRWLALGVNYEIYGKDITPSAEQASKIVRILGGRPPLGFAYELFLDEDGSKISKSKGNGLSMEDWLHYAPEESLELFLFAKPRTAKRLSLSVLPKTVDEFFRWRHMLYAETPEKRFENPAWFIERDRNPFRSIKPSDNERPISFALLLNLANVCHARHIDDLWQFLKRTKPNLERSKDGDRLLTYALRFSVEKIRPTLKYQQPDEKASQALTELAKRLRGLSENASDEDIQTEIYDIGKQAQYDPHRLWFETLYQCLLGQNSGPRMGSLFALYGLENSIKLIEDALSKRSDQNGKSASQP